MEFPRSAAGVSHPSHPQAWSPRPEPGMRIQERNPRIWARRRSVAALAALLALSCLLWAALHGLALKRQGETREELELLGWNCSDSGSQVRSELEALRAQLLEHQMKLRDINELLCRTIEDSQKCPEGWEFFGSSCFSFSSSARSWAGARDACARRGAHLAVVSSEDEQAFLLRKPRGNDSFWLGVTDAQHEGKWVWVTGEAPSFGFWDIWQEDPDKELKDCGALSPKGRWINERCSRPNRWICEKPWNC